LHKLQTRSVFGPSKLLQSFGTESDETKSMDRRKEFSGTHATVSLEHLLPENDLRILMHDGRKEDWNERKLKAIMTVVDSSKLTSIRNESALTSKRNQLVA